MLEFYGGFSCWLGQRWGFSAMTLGHAIIGRDAWSLAFCRDHEQAHVRQVERWGVTFIPAYLLASLLAWWRGQDYYLDNWFERDARAPAESRIDCSQGDANRRQSQRRFLLCCWRISRSRCFEKISNKSSRDPCTVRSWPFFTTRDEAHAHLVVGAEPQLHRLGRLVGVARMGRVVEVGDDLDDRPRGQAASASGSSRCSARTGPSRRSGSGPGCGRWGRSPTSACRAPAGACGGRRPGPRRRRGSYQLALTSMLDSPAGSPEFRVRGGVPVERLLDRLAREVEADAGAVDLGLAAWGGSGPGRSRRPGGNADADPVGQAMGLVPGGPEAQVLGFDTRARRTRCSPAPGLRRRRLRPRPLRVDVGDQCGARRARSLGRKSIARGSSLAPGWWGARSSGRRPGPEAATAKSSAGSRTRSGGPSFQPSANCGRRRQVLGVAPRCARFGPGVEDGDLLAASATGRA